MTTFASATIQRKRNQLGIISGLPNNNKEKQTSKTILPNAANFSPNPLRLNFMPRKLAVRENAGAKARAKRKICFIEAGEVTLELECASAVEFMQLQGEVLMNGTTSSSNATPTSITDELTNIPEPQEVQKKLLESTENGRSKKEEPSIPVKRPLQNGSNDNINGNSQETNEQKKYLKLSQLTPGTSQELRPKENGKDDASISPSTSSSQINGNGNLPRKRLLSERCEQESRFPTINRATIFNDWDGCRFVAGKRAGVGLYNPLNNCFLNSVLQAIVHIPHLARMLFEGKDSRMCTGNGTFFAPNCFHCDLRKHIQRVVQSAGPFQPFWINNHLRKIFPSHRPGIQEDAHEMLTLLLSALEPQPSKPLLNGLKTTGGTPSTPIDQIFGGNLRNEVICNVCSHTHTNYERIRELNLGLTRPNNATLVELLLDFFKPEQLHNFLCSKCQKKQTATRHTHLLSSPSVLIIQLKRFNSLGGKNRTPVRVPAHLQLGSFTYKREQLIYKLHGVIEHIGGGINFGHYVCAMRGFDNKTFYHFDDSDRKPIGYTDIADYMEPYILFYTKFCPQQSQQQSTQRHSLESYQPPLPKQARMIGVSPFNGGTKMNNVNVTRSCSYGPSFIR